MGLWGAPWRSWVGLVGFGSVLGGLGAVLGRLWGGLGAVQGSRGEIEEDRGGSRRIGKKTDRPRGRVRVGVNPYPLGWWVGEVAALNAWPKGRRITLVIVIDNLFGDHRRPLQFGFSMCGNHHHVGAVLGPC